MQLIKIEEREGKKLVSGLGFNLNKYDDNLKNFVSLFIDEYVSNTRKVLKKIENFQKQDIKEETYICNGEYCIDTNPFDKIIKIENCITKESFNFNYNKINKTNPDAYKKILKFLSEENGMKLDSNGYIYLITDGEYTKIGATKYNVNKRLSELQTGNPRKLKTVYRYRVKNKLTTEKFLHEKFNNKNILGEWFLLDQNDISDIMINKFDIQNSYKPTELLDWEEENIDCSINYTHELKVKFANKLMKRNKIKYFYAKEMFLNSFKYSERIKVKEILEFIENYK